MAVIPGLGLDRHLQLFAHQVFEGEVIPFLVGGANLFETTHLWTTARNQPFGYQKGLMQWPSVNGILGRKFRQRAYGQVGAGQPCCQSGSYPSEAGPAIGPGRPHEKTIPEPLWQHR